MFSANCLLCGAENSGNVGGACASLLDTEGFDFAPRAQQTSKLYVRVSFGLLTEEWHKFFDFDAIMYLYDV